MIYILGEVFSNILCQLPVSSLLRFRCVSKSWWALIDSPGFIKLHLNHSLELRSSSANAELILYRNSSFYSIPFDSLDSHVTDSATVVLPRELHGSPLPIDDEIHAIGYCNGLFFVGSGSKHGLWNPSTRKCRLMPDFEFKKLPDGIHLVHFRCGFGYDQATGDYKVVDIMQATGAPFEACNDTMVYSLKSNCWRRIKAFPHWIYSGKEGTFARGALHWLAFAPGVNNELIVVALDLRAEEYEDILLPLGVDTSHQIDLGVLNGCLSMSCCYKSDRVDMWLMKEYQNGESWVKLLSIALVDVKSCSRNVIPVAYSRSGEYILLEKDHENLMWYDLTKKAVKKIRMSFGPKDFGTFFHLGCLAPLNSGGGHEVGRKTGCAEMEQNKPKKRDDFLSKGFKLKL